MKLGVVATLDADDKFDLLCRRLRTTALKYGAAVALTSAKGNGWRAVHLSSAAVGRLFLISGMVCVGVNVDTLVQYARHRLHGVKLTVAPRTTATPGDLGLFIPAGLDSQDLIDAVRERDIPLRTLLALIYSPVPGCTHPVLCILPWADILPTILPGLLRFPWRRDGTTLRHWRRCFQRQVVQPSN